MTTYSGIPKYGLRPEEFGSAVGSVQLASEMQQAGWIKPVIHRHKLVLFDAGDVAKCWARILKGEVPAANSGAVSTQKLGACHDGDRKTRR